MLAPYEFIASPLSEAKPLSLLLPKTKHGQPFLIGAIEKKPVGVFVGDQHRFEYFECEGARNWDGLLIPGVTIEIDETSLFDPMYEDASAGALLRKDATLSVLATSSERYAFYRAFPVQLVEGLPPCHGDNHLAFRRWQIVLGSGLDKRILKTIDVTPQSSS